MGPRVRTGLLDGKTTEIPLGLLRARGGDFLGGGMRGNSERWDDCEGRGFSKVAASETSVPHGSARRMFNVAQCVRGRIRARRRQSCREPRCAKILWGGDCAALSFMSHRHLAKPKQPPQPVVWWRVALISAVPVVLLVALFCGVSWVHSYPSTYKTAPGRILEIRKVVDGIVESRFGGRILYGVEAHVQYKVDGQMRDRWLRVTDDLLREHLLLKLASHPTECVVYWPPDHPENVRCSLK